MSIDNSTSKIQYTLSSATQTLPVPFYFLAEGDLKVIKAGTTETVLILDTDYTVTGEGDPDGGSVILTGTDTDIGDDITITRDVAITQPVDYEENDKFPAEVHERALDRLTMIAQQLQESVSRSIKVPETEPADTVLVLPTKTARENTVLAFDEDGEIVAIPDSDSALAQTAANAAAAAESAEEAADIVAALSPLPTDKLLGRTTAGTGPVEQLDISDYFQSLFTAASEGAMRLLLGLGTLATQAASSVGITGGTMNGTAIGGSTPAAGSFTNLTATGTVSLGTGAFSVLSSDYSASFNVTQAGSLGADVIFNATNAPTITLTSGTWLIDGTVAARTSDVADTIYARFFTTNGSQYFGGGAAHTLVSGNLPRVPLTVKAVVTVSSSSPVFFAVFRAGSSTLDVGSASSPAGFMQAVKLPI